MALHESIGWILRLELLWVGCVKSGSIGADIVEEKTTKTTCTRGYSLRSIDALLTLIEMTDMELCVYSYGEESCVEDITGIWSWLEYSYSYLPWWYYCHTGNSDLGLRMTFLLTQSYSPTDLHASIANF